MLHPKMLTAYQEENSRALSGSPTSGQCTRQWAANTASSQRPSRIPAALRRPNFLHEDRNRIVASYFDWWWCALGVFGLRAGNSPDGSRRVRFELVLSECDSRMDSNDPSRRADVYWQREPGGDSGTRAVTLANATRGELRSSLGSGRIVHPVYDESGAEAE